MRTKIPLTFIFAALISGAGASLAAPRFESLSLTLDIPPTKAYPYVWGRDPFAPLMKDMVLPGLRLTAIFYNDTKPSGIINGNIVYAGSVVNGQKVLEIGKTHVNLIGEAGRVRLEIAGVPELKYDAKKEK